MDLEGGGIVSGQLLKETDNTLWLDIGVEVLKLSKDKAFIREGQENTAPRETHSASGEKTAPPRKRQSVEAWVDSLGKGVVEIHSRSGQGSGFILSEDGLVMTNYHVIAGDRELTVTVFQQEQGTLQRTLYKNIRILASDPKRDLALLKIMDELEAPLIPLAFGSANDMKTGETVFAIGSPLGLDRTVSRGIVSLSDRIIDGQVYLQATAQINPGNSGGPLFNLKGEVIGVNTLKLMRVGIEGMGFAVPVESVQLFLDKRNAYAFDPLNPNTGFHYMNPPRKTNTLP